MNNKIKKVISQMTLEEKAGLCIGFGFWNTKPLEHLGVPSIMVSDGPHGVRCQGSRSENVGVASSLPATCFPTAATIACSFDRELISEMGSAIGEECQSQDVSILLGPGANIKRSPLGGRNFEYFSEDPYLSGEMASAHIKGVQSQGVGTTIKHFAVNNQEDRRMCINVNIDERTLREIYLASFERVIKQAQPWTVMCAYNKINGDYCAQNEKLLTKILRDEWGFEGFVMSDWGAVDFIVNSVSAGLDLEMPGTGGISEKILLDAVNSGKLPVEKLDTAVSHLLTVILKSAENKKQTKFRSHHDVAKRVATESMVLLKNENDILPLKSTQNIAIIGEFAQKARFQGGGSSNVNAIKVDVLFDECKKISDKVSYAQGYSIDDEENTALLSEAINLAKKSDIAVLAVGLPDEYESEGFDRSHLSIPVNQIKLIEEISNVQKNIVVVLFNGSPVEMPWIDKTSAILEAYLGGEAAGSAISELLFGLANPCGKLAESFPKKLSHNPSYLNFPGNDTEVCYAEGVYVGYRYYDTKGIEPLFPFGFGLSYTKFDYTDISVDKKVISDTDTLTVKVKVKNVGKVFGKEIVQLYVKPKMTAIARPVKELKGFLKVSLAPCEEKELIFTLDKRSFAYYNVDICDWHVLSGDYEILACKSSSEEVLSATVTINSMELPFCYDRNSLLSDLFRTKNGMTVYPELRAKIAETGAFPDDFFGEDGMPISPLVPGTPLRGIISLSCGKFSENDLANLLEKLNRK